MRGLVETIQGAINHGWIPFVMSMGDRRSVRVNMGQLINALTVAAITAAATSYVTVVSLKTEMDYQKTLLAETRAEVAALRAMVYDVKSQRTN